MNQEPEKEEYSEDYPLGGTIEPYDIMMEQEYLEELERKATEKK